jgi:hypothetical protein
MHPSARSTRDHSSQDPVLRGADLGLDDLDREILAPQ